MKQRAGKLAQGGKFKHGFFSGMFASMAGSGMEASGWGVFSTDAGQLVTAAVVGGTAAELGGGKFANGAVTGAYTMLFNHMAHRPEDPPYGDNIVTSFGWPKNQPFTAIRPAGPKIQAYTIFLKYNPNGEAVFLFFNNERDYSHFYNYILGK